MACSGAFRYAKHRPRWERKKAPTRSRVFGTSGFPPAKIARGEIRTHEELQALVTVAECIRLHRSYVVSESKLPDLQATKVALVDQRKSFGSMGRGEEKTSPDEVQDVADSSHLT